MEIERKFLINSLDDVPYDLATCEYHEIEQAYLCVNPTVRIRKWDNEYILTYKSGRGMAHIEEEHPLNEEAYRHLSTKADGRVIVKRRYIIPLEDLKIELDVFEGDLAPLVLAEVEFPSIERGNAFTPPEWFGRDVTETGEYQNARLSRI